MRDPIISRFASRLLCSFAHGALQHVF